MWFLGVMLFKTFSVFIYKHGQVMVTRHFLLGAHLTCFATK